MPNQTLTREVITAAIDGFEAQRLRIDAQIAELRGMLNEGRATPAVASEPAPRGRRRISAAGRKRIAEAQRKRWAASRNNAEAPQPKKQKRKLSAAGKAAIVAALKRRWAAKRAEVADSANAAAPPAKKAARKKVAAEKS